MNDRLKELMLEAGYAAPEIAGRANKLAELIVRECMAQIKEVKELSLPYNANREQSYEFGYDDGMTVAIRTIEEHFGVDE